MPDEVRLREQARAAIKTGRLPSRKQDGSWGGPGTGMECVVCGKPVTKDEPEFELEFAHDGTSPGVDVFHLHVRCFAAWEFERTKPPQS